MDILEYGIQYGKGDNFVVYVIKRITHEGFPDKYGQYATFLSTVKSPYDADSYATKEKAEEARQRKNVPKYWKVVKLNKVRSIRRFNYVSR